MCPCLGSYGPSTPQSSPSMPCAMSFWEMILGCRTWIPWPSRWMGSLAWLRVMEMMGFFGGFVMDWYGMYGFWFFDGFSVMVEGFLCFLMDFGWGKCDVFGGTSGIETNPSNFVGSRCAYTKLVSTKTHCRFMKYHSHRPWPWRTRCRLTLHCQRCGSTGFAAWVCPKENPRPDVFADRGSQHPTCFYRSIFPMGHG